MVALNSEIKERDFSNSPELAEVQREAIDQASRYTGEMLERYNQHPDTSDGRYICADTFKELFAVFENKDDRAKVNNAIHNSAAVLSATQFDEILKREEPDKSQAIFVTGIPGSGKTTTVKNMMMRENTKLLFEGQLARPQPAFHKIEQCLGKGLEVTVVAVSMTAERALDNTYRRFNEYGRGASIGIMADIQANLPNGLRQIHERFGNAVKIVGINQDKNSEFLDRFDDVLNMLSLGSQDQILGRLAGKIQSDLVTGKIDVSCFNQAKGSMNLESIFAEKEYVQQRVVVNSKSVVLEAKLASGIWTKLKIIPVQGMKGGVYPLGTAKPAAADQSYEGEIVYKDNASIFQQTKQGLVRHQNTEQLAGQVRIGQHYAIGNGQAKAASLTASRSMKQTHSRRLR